MDGNRLDQALANLRAAVEGKERGVKRVFDRTLRRHVIQRSMCQVLAGDVLAAIEGLERRDPALAAALDKADRHLQLGASLEEAAKAIDEPWQRALFSLKAGCQAGRPEREVGLQADDVYELLEHS